MSGLSRAGRAPGIRQVSIRLFSGLILCTAAISACATEAAKPDQISVSQPTSPIAPVETEPVGPPTATLLPAASPTDQPSPIPISSSEPSPTSIPTDPCQEDLCVYASPLFLRRPIDPPANDSVDPSYRFGSTQSGMREPHHGVEFLNPNGTPVFAAGDGTVVVAGTDVDPITPHGAWPILFYGPYSNFYGNLVVIEHPITAALQAELPDLVGPLFSLYGHLSAVSVEVGQQVTAGQQIGAVGMAGIATGSHLHFEVRIGENSYKASRNPELWLSPHLGTEGQLNGAIAGHFLDSYGATMEMPSITIQHLPDGPESKPDFQVTVITYEEKALIDQPPFYNSFGVGDLPAGLYRIAFPMGGLRRELIQVYPGQLTVVTFRSEQ